MPGGGAELPLAVPAAEAVELVAANLGVEVAQGKEAGEGGHFVLSGQHHADASDGRREVEPLRLAEAAGEPEASLAVNGGAGDGGVEGGLGRPGGDRVFALGALEQAEEDLLDGVQAVGGLGHQQVGQAGGGAGVDQGHPALGQELLVEA